MTRAARMLVLLMFVGLAASAGRASDEPAAPSPWADAMAVWHMAGLDDAAGRNSRLVVRGEVAVGIDLTGSDRQASLQRGGDGRAAEFGGGCLDAGQGADGELNVSGEAMTLAVRLRDPSGTWNCPLLAKHGGHAALVYNLFSHDFGSGVVLGFELGSTGNQAVLRTTVPMAEIGLRDWHDVICRVDGAKLEMFVDGRCVDEDFLLGVLRTGNTEPCLIGGESYGGQAKTGFRGLVDHAAIWNRALSDDEILTLSGGPAVADRRVRTDAGSPGENMQYWRPPNQYFVGDCLPFFHDGTFHFVYLLDKNHHRSKNHLGAHQWAQAVSTDLVHWQHQPLAIPITHQREGSICTGSVFPHDGTYYGFYATRMPDGTQHLSLATSRDGIHFAKQQPNPFASPQAAYDPLHYRDPTVFRDESTGRFHLLVTARLTDPRGGCLAHLVSSDLKSWELQEPFLVTGNVPECPDVFSWNGWHYLVFSPDGLARYRISRGPLGPWETPAPDVFGSPLERVAKTAAFTGQRRLSASFLADGGYAGHAVFRELVQNPDGTLGTRFVPEMAPTHGDALVLRWQTAEPGAVSDDGRRVRLPPSPTTATAALGGNTPNVRMTARIEPAVGAGSFGIRVGGCELRIDPTAQTVRMREGPARIEQVTGLDRAFDLEIILKDDILDASVDRRRTLISRIATPAGGPLTLFSEGRGVVFDKIEIRPLQHGPKRKWP